MEIHIETISDLGSGNHISIAIPASRCQRAASGRPSSAGSTRAVSVRNTACARGLPGAGGAPAPGGVGGGVVGDGVVHPAQSAQAPAPGQRKQPARPTPEKRRCARGISLRQLGGIPLPPGGHYDHLASAALNSAPGSADTPRVIALERHRQLTFARRSPPNRKAR